jgi:hypothetical protein
MIPHSAYYISVSLVGLRQRNFRLRLEQARLLRHCRQPNRLQRDDTFGLFRNWFTSASTFVKYTPPKQATGGNSGVVNVLLGLALPWAIEHPLFNELKILLELQLLKNRTVTAGCLMWLRDDGVLSRQQVALGFGPWL